MAVSRVVGVPEQLELEGELTCPICLDLYRDPRQLPCLHAYCTACVSSLLRRSVNRSISCPKCSRVVPTQGPDQVYIFPKAFKLNRLLDIYHNMVAKGGRVGMCQEHPSQELALFCETCDRVMCRDCYIRDGEHLEHERGYIKDLVPKYRGELALELEEMKVTGKLSHALESTELTLDHITRFSGELRLKVEERFDELTGVFLREKRNFLAAIDREMTARKEMIASQRVTLLKLSKDASSTISLARELCESASDTDFLTERKQISNDIRDTVSKVNELLITPQPQVSADVGIEMLDSVTLEATCRSHTHILSNPAKCSADISRLADAKIDEEMTVQLTHTSCGRIRPDVKCALTLTRNDTKTGKVSATHVGAGKHNIVLSPQERGRHQLSITIDGTHVPGSPFEFKVKAPFTVLPALLSEATTTLACSKPFGLTCMRDGSTVLMLEEGKRRIAILKDRVVSGVMAVPSQFLAELTTDRSGNIYVTTGETDQILKLDGTGKLVQATGSSGSGPSEFNFPNGININTLDELYVCDTGNHRIKVLDTNLNLLRIIETKAKDREPFQSPHDVAFDKLNNVYIVESKRIQVISPEWHYMRTIGETVLSDAVCIKMVGTSLFVTDFGKGCISIFSTDGKFVRDFGADSFTRPQGITVDADGFVYVTTNRDKLCVF